MPKISRLLESSLYVADVDRAAGFYQRLFGFPTLSSAPPRFHALDVSGRQVLLFFKHGTSVSDSPSDGGIIPGHDGSGTDHLAFAIEQADLDAWRAELAKQNVKIESTVTWPRGGTSLYFRDPDGHLVELATPGIWATY